MTRFNYYLVISHLNGFPFFTTCAEVDGKFFRIIDLENFLENGINGISDEEVECEEYSLIHSKNFTIHIT